MVVTQFEIIIIQCMTHPRVAKRMFSVQNIRLYQLLLLLVVLFNLFTNAFSAIGEDFRDRGRSVAFHKFYFYSYSSV